jgi:hypothetical protein
MPEGEGPPQQQPFGRARSVSCVMWHAPDASLRPELLAALQRPGFVVQACTDPYSAVAHVIQSTSREVMESQSPVDLVVLVLVEPKQLRELHAALAVVQRCVPQAVLWMFDSLATPQLRAVRAEDLAMWGAGVAAERPTPERGFGASGSGAAQPGKLLTDEELSMLLDAEPKDDLP